MTATLAARNAAANPARTRGFVPALEGMRGMAALGVLLTHVAFQTGATGMPVLGRIWERFDMAVAVFFALSGFLLWRPHATAARDLGAAPSVGYYLRHRAARILPAYWAVVCFVLILLPSAADTAGWRVWASNLALTQVFVPLTLTDGLTQMWSLSVEVAFYLVLPLLAFALVRLRGKSARWRAPAVLALALVSLSWNFLPVPTPDAIHADNWLPAYLPWFAAGMLLAELVDDVHPLSIWRRIGGNQLLMWTVALIAFLLSSTDFGGPAGLTRAEPWQYAAKMALGAIIGFGLLAPLVLGDRKHRWLESSVAATLGRWSYGIFLWHLAVLTIVFPVFGILPFGGNFVYVLVLTVAITLPVAAASYALVEEPSRRLARRMDRRKTERKDAGVAAEERPISPRGVPDPAQVGAP
ncbi:acyltransferase family protein [Nocardia bhagyanarayanae]|uniref:Peptidoglycan/LPS O-acetylase OafA/YrhL n=1 Tax=Nocardia bhagyanarayanae TaxID=1215925 RepID=A0A543F7V2_9NOCA|nr:acyltransferase [Nocardia bhagyanarayanae]TQM29830.1 peptidoglycan/LPS O-acetylase OafA/YrhL [Nocardia bhagyanarayanae]